MEEINKRLEEIERELRELYVAADNCSKFSSNLTGVDGGWFWAAVNYWSIGASANGYAQKC